jgi:hypothetical protein
MDEHRKGNAKEQPLTGLNHSLHHMGQELHVQTEDLGAKEQCIETQVFCGGCVILSTRADYSATSKDHNGREVVAELMRRQHFGVIQEIERRLGL